MGVSYAWKMLSEHAADAVDAALAQYLEGEITTAQKCVRVLLPSSSRSLTSFETVALSATSCKNKPHDDSLAPSPQVSQHSLCPCLYRTSQSTCTLAIRSRRYLREFDDTSAFSTRLCRALLSSETPATSNETNCRWVPVKSLCRFTLFP